MDCNQVFMILTRGPFPTGEAWDEEVEAHLESCADCWRLADALRPALEVFQEAVPAAEGRDLPGYWGDARPASAAVAHVANSGVRTALASSVRQISRPNRHYRQSPLANEISAEVLRAVVLTSTVTAAVIGLLLLWRS
jgi:hypothetical protein